MNCQDVQLCPCCGDRLIHQSNRQFTESHSGWGQHLHDTYGRGSGLPNRFDYVDVDSIIYKVQHRILRFVEQKRPGQELDNAQRRVLDFMARVFELLVQERHLNPESGVFRIQNEAPWNMAMVSRVLPTGRVVAMGPQRFLVGDALRAFETGEPVTPFLHGEAAVEAM